MGGGKHLRGVQQSDYRPPQHCPRDELVTGLEKRHRFVLPPELGASGAGRK